MCTFITWRVGAAEAAQVASSGTSDEIRCSSVGYTRFSSTTWGQFSKCYVAAAWPASWQGTHRTVSSGTTEQGGSIAAVYDATDQFFTGCTTGGTINREAWYGPWTGSPYGNLPAQSVVYRTNCTNGTYWNNVNSTQSSNLDDPLPYYYAPGGTAWAVTGSDDTVDATRTGSQGGLQWHGIVASLPLAELIPWPPDWFVGGAEWTDEEEFCGAAVSAPGWDGTEIIEAGDVVGFEVEWSSGITGNVQIKWPSTDLWVTIHTEGTIANPSTFDATVTAPANAPGIFGYRLGETVMRCWHVIDERYVYLLFSAADETVNDGHARPCSQAKFYWPRTTPLEIGDTAEFELVYSGILNADVVDTTISIDYAVLDPARIVEPPIGTWTWTNLDTGITLGSRETYNVVAEYAGDEYQFRFRCTDELGTMTNEDQFAVGKRMRGVVGGFNDEALCYATSGLGLNPISWVPGLVRMGFCVTRVMFVPSDDALEGLYEAGEEVSERAPVSYVVDGTAALVTTVNGLPEAVAADTTSCWTVFGGDEDVFDEAGVSLCPSAAGAGAGPWATARTFLELLWWVAFSLALFLASMQLIS